MAVSINFDFEPYINSYKGRTRIKRALFIAEHCPSLEVEAYHFAVNDIKQQLSDIELYQACIKKLNAALTRRNEPMVDIDAAWVDATTKKNKRNLEQLETELKTCKTSVVKESIRIAQTNLGDYYYDVGKMSDASKCYSRTRDYCSTSKSILDMCFNMIKVHLEERHYVHVHSYIVRAETTPQIPDKVNTISRLKCCQAIASLFISDANRYQTVAQCLTQGVALESSHLIHDIMSPNDVALYGGLCALASFERSQLHDLISSNVAFKGYLELVPHVREIMEYFHASKYAACFSLMENYREDWKLDIYLNSHIDPIFQCVREKAMVQYCIPYSIVDLGRMASAFHTTVDQLESELVKLIGQKGKIDGRIDSHEKVLYFKQQDQRKKAFDQSLGLAVEYEKSAKALMLRLNLLKSNMIVQ
ncbi:26S proteasome subunit RPN7-domain-containing protein [Halteromyces radiatus]|uniref:26S proteasome subunit RPN7-domain-containing protein n=1 Tax=Halteromyces radiatus TaxID=101107 RepID=UPI00221F5E8E|nr:26S proteasome subunit RPN7-domain-containing protein [Halteromyces radiatus]KAI8084756.1 26S proteasome subunit RPN7-domain-containing protein [Halteromyces radiatus]